jgi:hypothetical protein
MRRIALGSVQRELARWDWVRGFLGTSMLLLLVITVASGIFQYRIGSLPPSAKWPYIDWDRIVAVCAPAAAFWFWFFARYRRPEAPSRDESKALDPAHAETSHEMTA